MLKSHPDKKLTEHLNGVKEWGEYFLKYSPNEIVKKHSDKELLECFLLLHDIGKATMYFQKYINSEQTDKELKTHAHLSALIFLNYVTKIGKTENYEQTIKSMYMSIFKHHDQLSTLKECIEITCSEEEKVLMQKQWESINKKELKEVFEELGLDTSIIRYTFDELYGGIKSILMKWARDMRKEDMKIRNMIIDNELSFENYLLTQNLYSLLIDADKCEVVLGNIEIIKNMSLSVNVDKYLKSKVARETKINQMRQEAFNEVESKLDRINEKRIYTLTLPTGMGKTLNSLNFAFKLKEKLEKEDKINYKVIYSLPFMSIIDQTVEVIEKIFETNKISPDTQFLLKSHHLAELEWREGENILDNTQESKMLIEGWNSQVIVTTFIQLFETLIGYRNNSQRKYHQLSNSIIVIDEIQSLPVKYYKVIRNLLLEFTKYSNSRCIIMTATQPQIFKKEEKFELCDSNKYYTNLQRTVIFNETDKERKIDEFVEELNIDEEKTYLIVLNTIKSTVKLYDALKEKFINKRIVLLNTNFPPLIRKQIIQNIKDKKYDIIVSTQLIEAGVDIDVNVVYRDFCPLPSLLQSSGRAGREGMTKGEVHFIKLVDDNSKAYAKYIYDIIDLELTKEVLEGYKEIPENSFIEIINKYYEKIADPDKKSQDESNKLIKGLNLEKFSKRDITEEALRYAQDFKLIEENAESINVFLEINEEAQRLWKMYEETLQEEIENLWEKKARIDNIRRKINEYVVTVRLSKEILSKNLPPIVYGYYYVEMQMIEYYYSNEYGYGKNDTIFM